MKTIILLLLVSIMSSCNSGKSGMNNNLSKADDLKGSWMLIEVDGVKVTLSDNNANNVSLSLGQSEGGLHGQSWCNTYFGSYTASDGKVTIGDIGATRMACDQIMDEQNYFNILQKMTSFSITDKVLTLSGDSHELKFSRAFTK